MFGRPGGADGLALGEAVGVPVGAGVGVGDGVGVGHEFWNGPRSAMPWPFTVTFGGALMVSVKESKAVVATLSKQTPWMTLLSRLLSRERSWELIVVSVPAGSPIL